MTNSVGFLDLCVLHFEQQLTSLFVGVQSGVVAEKSAVF